MQTDLPLLDAARRMDREALEKIFDLYASPLYNYALRLCRDPMTADHIVGDVFGRLLEHFASGSGPTSNLRSYLYEMVYHLIVDETRYAQRRAPLDVLMNTGAEARAGLGRVEDPLLFDIILHAMENDLTPDQRHVIVLRFIEGFSLRETAAILGKGESHIKVIQSRALKKIRKIFDARETRAALALPRRPELPHSLRA